MCRTLVALFFVFTPIGTIAALDGRPEPVDTKTADKFAADMLVFTKLVSEKYIKPVPESQLTRWAVEGLFVSLNQPLPKEIAGRLETWDKPTREDMSKLLRDARAHLGRRKELENDGAIEVGIFAVFAKLEPVLAPGERSRYISEAVKFNGGEQVGSPGGVGLSLKKDAATGYLRVVTPVLDGPAYKSGIRAGDLVTLIRIDTDTDGKALAEPLIVSTKGMPVERAYELFLGRYGTGVRLHVIPAQASKEKK